MLLEQIYLKLGRKDTLKEFYAETVKRFPESIFWNNRAARFALMSGDLKTAEQLYQSAWQKSEQLGQLNRESLNGYLETLILSRQFDRLFVEAKKYVDTDLAPIALIEMADAEKRLGNIDNSLKYAKLAADKAQNNEGMLYEILRALFQIIGKEEVEKYCAENISKNPNSLPAYMMMANMKFLNNEFDKAIENIDMCVQLSGANTDKKGSFLMNKAVMLYQAYQKTSEKSYLMKTINTYESLLAELPKNNSAVIMNNLAFMIAESGERLEEALKYAKQADELKPNTPDFLDTYAYVLYKNGRYTEADERMQAALQLFDARQMKPSWKMYERSGEIKEKIGANIQALANYKRALEAGEGELSVADTDRIKAALERVSPQK
jgi:tetratricopeptide (TPR) repeat protein